MRLNQTALIGLISLARATHLRSYGFNKKRQTHRTDKRRKQSAAKRALA